MSHVCSGALLPASGRLPAAHGEKILRNRLPTSCVTCMRQTPLSPTPGPLHVPLRCVRGPDRKALPPGRPPALSGLSCRLWVSLGLCPVHLPFPGQQAQALSTDGVKCMFGD